MRRFSVDGVDEHIYDVASFRRDRGRMPHAMPFDSTSSATSARDERKEHQPSPRSDDSRSSVTAWFAALGERVAAGWRAAEFEESSLPEIAETELARSAPASVIGIGQLIRETVLSERFVFQQYFDSTFGQPPLTLFWHPRFHIEALFWTTSTTAIHNHGFDGAFTVLHGSSLQTTFTFEDEERLCDDVAVGRVVFRGSEVLTPGRIQRIVNGDRFIHSVFHLESPSVTLVVRTRSSGERGVRREYLRPCIAVNAHPDDQQLSRRLQCLDVLRSTSPDEYRVLARELVEGADVATRFHVLRQAFMAGPSGRAIYESLEAAASNRGDRVRQYRQAFEEIERQTALVQLRRRVTHADLRFALALMMTQTSREAVLSHVAARVPDRHPADTLLDWFGELEALGVLSFRLDAISTRVLRERLSGSAAGAEPAPVSGDLLTQREAQLARVALLAPLFN